MENHNVIVSSSPHIRAKASTRSIMQDVLIALVPSLISGVIFYGFRVLWILALSIGSCVAFEYLWQHLLKKPIRIGDLSAAVTGVLLAFNLPVTVPWWIPVIGAFVSIIIVKELYGGIGSNFMNPAMVGRVFLSVSWPILMTQFCEPFIGHWFGTTDVITSATPLAILKSGEGIEGLPSFVTLFLGGVGGCIGETSALALLLGGLYLVYRRVINLRIPLSFVGAVALLSFLFTNGSLSPFDNMMYHVLSGGLFLGAFFMATDYATSPVAASGQIIMGIGCGLITFMIRRFGGYPEGVSYAILLMNVATPLIDKVCKPKKYGYVRRGSSAKK
ncbi:MAG: RnfABCDGE type electron transport complex subunit D [Clostridia bacterium]|nr:RnfABCDGE type electron transport complex subunit D [Clostridia bacterium]